MGKAKKVSDTTEQDTQTVKMLINDVRRCLMDDKRYSVNAKIATNAFFDEINARLG